MTKLPTDFNDVFLRAALGKATPFTPVWYMRQAGRYMPEYRELRKKYDVLTLTQTPELAAEISLQPVHALGVDAAILFADIMLVPLAMGVKLQIVDSVGPVIAKPILGPVEVAELHGFAAADIEYLSTTIRILRGELKVPLIGFAGAPFTLASYLIEGKPSREWTLTKRFMYEQPEAWHVLMAKLTEAIIFYLDRQVIAGAQALQLFDSWVGCLSVPDFVEFVQPYNQQIFTALGQKGTGDGAGPVAIPRIIFGTNTAAMFKEFSDVAAEVAGVDWRMNLRQARTMSGPLNKGGKVLQGNLDPVLLLGPWPRLQTAIDGILAQMRGHSGFIFNLGHGVPRETDPDVLKRVTEYVHEHTAR